MYTSRKIRKNYLKKAEKQLGDSDVYEEVSDDPEPLITTIHRPIEKIRKRRELKKETIKYFEVKTQNFLGFICCLIHKRLNNLPGRPAISNCGCYTENMEGLFKCCSYHLFYCKNGIPYSHIGIIT